MAAIIESKFRNFSAQKTIEGLFQTLLSQNNIYAFIGKTSSWPDETSPPVPIDSTLNDNQSWFDMMSLKKLNPGDCTTVIPRYDWASNIVYAQYEDNVDLFATVGTLPFFVMTDEFNVYKCIFNNFGNISFVKPTGTSTNVISGRDKYLWKYMFTVNESNQLKYLTDAWVPCTTLITNDGSQQWSVQQAAIPGTIEVIDVTNGGSGYTGIPAINIVGDGTGAIASPIINLGVIVGVQMINKGKGYTLATATITGGGGSNATLKPVMSPAGGHGSDAAKELGATITMFDVKFVQSESGVFSVVSEFRKVGMILNPILYGSDLLATNAAYSQSTNLLLSGVTGVYQPNDVVTGSASNATGIVLDYNLSNGLIRLVEVNGTFQPGETISNQLLVPVTGLLQLATGTSQGGNTSTTIVLSASDTAPTNFYQNDTLMIIAGGTGAGQSRMVTGNNSLTKQATVATAWNVIPDSTSQYAIAYIKSPDIQPNSGKILYIENRRPIKRDAAQTEDVKMVVEF